MAYDAVKMKDWQISEAAEKNMPSPEEWREKMGLEKDEIMPYGRLARLDFMKIMKRLKRKKDGKYIEVTAITPTPLGEGKSTTSCGLMEGLGKRGKNVGGALRQPSGGPTMNIKGTAAGGCSLDVHGGTAGGLAERAAHIFTAFAQAFHEAAGRGALAFTQRGGGDGGHFNVIAIFFALKSVDNLEKIQFGDFSKREHLVFL